MWHDIDNNGCRVHPIYHSIKKGTQKQKVNLEKVRKQVAQTIFRLNEYARKTFSVTSFFGSGSMMTKNGSYQNYTKDMVIK